MEGDAAVEIPFGDSLDLRAHTARFHQLHPRLHSLRNNFTRHVADVLAAMPEDGRYCPNGASVPYFRAHRAGQLYEQVGAEIERHYDMIRRLDELGSGIGLTPGDRFRVAEAHEIYQVILRDYAEMRTVMGSHVQPALRYRRCSLAELVRRGAAQAPGEMTIAPPLSSARATFFVDNSACTNTFELYLDDVPSGQIAPGERVAFQTESGRHSLCLIDHGSHDRCGQQGTVREAYIHDGWSMTTHCQ